jgi:DnaB-like helicase C terminal domain
VLGKWGWVVKPRMSAGIQEALVALICFSADDAKMVRGLVPQASFSPYYREIVKAADDYYEKYKIPPGIEHTQDLVAELVAAFPDRAEQYNQTYQSLLDCKDSINRDYILANAKVFIRHQRALATIQKALSLLTKPNSGATEIDEVESLFAGATKSSVDLSDPGILFNDPAQALRFLNKDVDEAIPTGIPELDNIGATPARKKYMLVESETSGGKSAFAVHLGKTAIRFGFGVCHVTLEMSADEVAQRYVQAFCSISKREANVVTTRLKKDSLGRVCEFTREKLKRPTFKDDKIAALLWKKLTPLRKKKKLYIKEFPSGTLTIRQLKAYLDQLEAVHSFQPSLVLIDYPDLMAHDVRQKRNELEKLAVDIRGIAGARNIATVGFSQVNEVKQGKVIRTGRSSEGRGKEFTADVILTLNSTEAERELGFVRIHNAKSRQDKRGQTILVSQNLAIGQFCIDSSTMQNKTYENLLDDVDGVD